MSIGRPVGLGVTLFCAVAFSQISLSPNTMNFEAAGGGSAVQIINQSQTAVTWTATTNVDWVIFTSSATGSGNGNISYTVRGNPFGMPRSGTVTVTPSSGSAQGLVIMQRAGELNISPSSQNVEGSGASGTLTVNSNDPVLQWTATSNQPWLTIMSGSTGTGPGPIRWIAAANTDTSARTGIITVTPLNGVGIPFSVSQQGGTAPAGSVSLNVSSVSADAAGSTGQVQLMATVQSITWTASSSQTWLAVNPGSGTGSATFSYTAAANPSAVSRIATITVMASQGPVRTLTVTQSGGVLNVSPPSASVTAAGGTGQILLATTDGALTWIATGGAPWLSVNAGSGSGSATLQWTVAANISTTGRSSVITITPNGGTPISFPVDQQGIAQGSFSVSPTTTTAPASRSDAALTVTSAVPSLTWTATASDSWVQFTSSPTGTGNGTISYSVAGTTMAVERTAVITVTPAAGAAATLTITQSRGFLSVSPSSSASVPATGGSGSFLIKTNNSTLQWTASVTATWLTITSAASGAGDATMTWAAAANLTSASRSAIIRIVPLGGATIIYTISQDSLSGALSVSQSTLTFSYQQRGALPADRQLILGSSPAGIPFDISASTANGVSWLTVSGTGPAPAVLTVSANPNGLMPGDYQGTITLRSQQATNSPVTVPVTLTVTPAPILISQPSNLNFSFQLKGSNPASQVVTLNTSTGGNLDYTILPDPDAPWLTAIGVGPAPSSLTVTVSPAGLGTGTVTGSVIINSPASGNSPFRIPVSLMISDAPSLISAPPSLTINVREQDPSPAPLVLGVTSSGTDVPFSASTTATWLTVTGGGSTPGQLQVLVNSQGMTTGNYQAAIVFNSAAAGNVPLLVPVVLNIAPRLVLNAQPAQLSFSLTQGGATGLRLGPIGGATSTLTVSSSDTPIAFTASAQTVTGGDWLSVTAAGSTTPSILNVSAAVGILTPGAYQGSIILTPSDPKISPVTVPVTLMVSAQPQLTLSSGQLRFSYQLLSGPPTQVAGQTIVISTPNAGTSITASASTSTGSPWLSTTSGGVSPLVIQATVDPTGLAAGTYSGAITVSSAGFAPGMVQVTLNVTDAPVLQTSPTTVHFSYQQGQSAPPPQSLPVSSSSPTAPLSFATFDGTTPWLIVTGGGTTPSNISVAINPVGLSAQQYRGSFTVASSQAGNSPVAISVILDVSQGPPILAQPASLTFDYTLQGAVPPPRSVAISSSAVLAFSTSILPQQSWLTLKGGGPTPANLEVTMDPTGLTPGSYAASILVDSPEAANTPLEIPVTLNIQAAPRLDTSLAAAVFSWQMGSALPSNQDVVANSSDSSLVVTASASTTEMGSWLAVGGGGSVPAAFSISVNPQGLAPGTYHGSISFQSQGAENSPVTIPVTLVVSAAPVLQASPSLLSLSYQIGGAVPSIAPINVRSSGLALDFQATASTDLGGAWLQITTGGTTPGLVTPSITPASLIPGIYTGSISFSSSGAGNPVLIVPVTLTVSTNLTLAASPNSLQFSAQQLGLQPAAQTLRISAPSAIAITYSISPGAPWLSVTGAGTTPADLSVSVATANLAPGTYAGLILVQSALAANSPLQIPVTLNVSASPVLEPSPATLRFSYTLGGVKPPPQSFAVSSGSPITYSFSTIPGPEWLFSSGSGTTPGTAGVAVDPGALSPGEYQGTVQLSSPSAGNLAAVSVILTVTTAPVLTVQPPQLTFAYQIGGQLPVNQSLVVGSGSDTLNVVAGHSSASNWLVISGGGATPAPFAISINPTGLAPGNYQDDITITSPDAPGVQLVVPVRLTVTNVPVLISLPNVLFFGVQLGAAAPPNRQITVVSSDGTALPVTAQATGASWLTVSGSSTTTPAVFTVTVNPGTLTPGLYLGSIVLSSPGSGAGSQVVTVNLTIASQPSLSSNPAALSFSGTPSLPPLPISVGITSDTPVPFVAAAGPGAPWLSVSGSGTTPGTATVSVNTAGLAVGSYHAAVFVTSSGAGNSPLPIPVELVVSSSASILTATPSTLTFNAIFNAGTRLTISSSVAGNSFSAVASPGTPWLIVNATGVTPAAVSVAINATGLIPGTYQGAIEVRAPGVGNSPLLVPVTLVVSTTPLLVASPSTVSFTYDSSGVLPPAQSIGLALGDGPASNAQATIAPGTPWLSLAQNSGSTISVKVNPSGLLPGTYTGSVQITAPGAGNSPLSVSVSFAVSGFPSFDFSQNAVALAALPQQSDPVSSVISVGGNSTTPFDVVFDVTGSTWLSLTPLSGRTPLNVTVTANPAGLRPGDYPGSISVSSGGNLIKTLPVNLRIAPQPALSVSPSFLVFNYFHGGDVPDPTNLYILRFTRPLSVIVSASDSWLSVNPSTVTDSGPIAVSVNPASLAPGTYHGNLTLAVTDPNTGVVLTQRQIPVDLYVDQPADPRIETVSNGMSFLATPLAPGLIFSLFGSGLGPSAGVVSQADPGTQLFPRSLGGVQVLVNGIECPLLYVSDTQINAIAPYAVYTKDSAIVTVRHNGILSTGVPVSVNPASPGLFSGHANGAGQGAILNQDQSVNSSKNPASKGTIISLFGGGEGQTAPHGIDGLEANGAPLPSPLLPVTVFIGGIPATNITYVGAAPTLTAGVIQVNVQIPPNAPSGDVSVVMIVGATASQQGLTVNIR